jgi:lysophospholipase L1-like esterase
MKLSPFSWRIFGAFFSLSALLSVAHAQSAPAMAPASAPAPTSFKFQFGAEPASAMYSKGEPSQAFHGLYTLVPASAVYSKEQGYGFEPGAQVTAVSQAGSDPLHRGAVTGSRPFAFSVAVPEGNYRVTVTLGDPQAAAVTTVKAEARRLMLESVHTAAGYFETRSFTVNIRSPKISTGGEVNLDSREMNLTTHVAIVNDWDDKLTVTFSDAHPALAALEIQKVDDAITVFVLGDSTVVDQPSGGNSWGQMLTRWFKPEVAIANHAESGETLKGFLKERRWEKVLDVMKPGDYVLIQFGTNDSKKSGPQNIYPGQDFSETYAEADTTYKDLLKQYVADFRKKGGIPIIVSPPARRGETDHSTLGAYAAAAGAAAKEVNAPFIDLNAMGMELNKSLGADSTRMYGDQTHTVDYGSYMFSRCVALGIKQDNLPLAKFIVDDFGDFDLNQPHPTLAEYTLPADAGNRGGRGAGPGRRGRAGGSGGPADTAAAPAPAAASAAPAATAAP